MNPQDHSNMNNNPRSFYNRGVSYYSWNPCNLVPDPNCMSVQHSTIATQVCKGTDSTSPWTTKSGFSSVSPPGTSSTNSSSNSEYGQSPDDLSVDSLINSLLRVVNGDDFNLTKANRYPSPVAGCRDCTESPCDPCFNAFKMQMLQVTQLPPSKNVLHGQHNLSPVQQFPSLYMSANESTSIRPMSAEIPPPILMQDCGAAGGAGAHAPLYCELHRDAQRFYCRTCSRPFCAECGPHQHAGHSTVHLMEAIEKAGHQATQVLHEAQHSVTLFKDDLDTLQVAAEMLEQRSRQATSDVMLCMRRVIQALEAREKELLDKIEKCRQAKFETLKARDEALRQGINRLTRASDRLQDAMEAATLASNPFDLLVTKDMASAEVFQMRNVRRHWQPLEENWISFTGPESNTLSAIASLGTIITSNPGPIGDRRTVRGRGNGGASPQVNDAFDYVNFFRGGSPPIALNPSQSFPLTPIPRGRAVSGSSFPVAINSGLLGQPQSAAKSSVVQIGNGADVQDNLCRPWGVACDRDGNVIVADRSNNRIQIFRMDGSFVRRFGTHGTGPGQFDRPAGIAVDSRRRIIVADKDNHRVQVLSMEGLFLLSFGEKGSRLGQFNYPWDVAVNSECQIVVSDTRNHRVQLFSPEGIFLRKYGFETTNSMWKNFDSPRGVAFNPEGNIAVTDFNNHRVVIVDADFMNSRVLGCDVGHGNRQVQRPQGLIVDDEGNIIVADSRNHRVLIFDSTGTLKGQVGSADRGPEQMDRPSGVALTPDGRILVVDFGNNRVLLI